MDGGLHPSLGLDGSLSQQRLFATWGDAMASGGGAAAGACVPRLCAMAVTRLTLFTGGAIEGEVKASTSSSSWAPAELDASVNRGGAGTVPTAAAGGSAAAPESGQALCQAGLVLAVKLKGHKRVLRSNELPPALVSFGSDGTLSDLDLDLTFALHYPHHVKRPGANVLQVLLQRKRRYKNRPIPGGFKTLACGSISLTDVLQSAVDRELLLYQLDPGDGLQSGTQAGNPPNGVHVAAAVQSTLGASGSQPPVAKLYLHQCSTQLADRETELHMRGKGAARTAPAKIDDPVPALLPLDSEEDGGDSNDSSNDDLCQSDSDNAHAGAQLAESQAKKPSSARGDPRARGSQQKGGSSARDALRKTVKGGFKHLVPPRLGPGPSKQQHNLKQKFVALLRRFKITEEELEEGCSVEGEAVASTRELEALFDELDNLSDSAPELDTISQGTIHSQPKPRLPVYFTGGTSKEKLFAAAHMPRDDSKDSADLDGQHGDVDEQLDTPEIAGWEELQPDGSGASARAAAARQAFFLDSSTAAGKHGARPWSSQPVSGAAAGGPQSPPLPAAQQASPAASRQPQQAEGTCVQSPLQPGGASLHHMSINEQLAGLSHAGDGAKLLDSLWLVSAADIKLPGVLDVCATQRWPTVVASCSNDVRIVLAHLVARIQKLFVGCNTSARAPAACTVLVLGADRFCSFVLRAYTELLAARSADWQKYIRFSLLPPPESAVHKALARLDGAYASGGMLADKHWADFWTSADAQNADDADMVGKLRRVAGGATSTVALPIAEAMLQLRSKSASGWDNSQVFVPFVLDVRLGCGPPDHQHHRHELLLHRELSAPEFAERASDWGGSAAPAPHQHQLGVAAMNQDLWTSPAAALSPPASPHVQGSASSDCSGRDLHLEYWIVPVSSQCGFAAMSTSVCSTATAASTGAAGLPLAASATSVGAAADSQLSCGQAAQLAAPTAAPAAVATGPGAAGKQLAKHEQAGATPVKFSVKASFRWLVVTRLPGQLPPSPDASATLTVHFVKEKKRDKVLSKLGMGMRGMRGASSTSCSTTGRDQAQPHQLQLQHVAGGGGGGAANVTPTGNEASGASAATVSAASASSDGSGAPPQQQFVAQQTGSVGQAVAGPVLNTAGSSKQHGTVRVCIDGVQWSHVKFFQVRSQWQTRVRAFPLALFQTGACV